MTESCICKQNINKVTFSEACILGILKKVIIELTESTEPASKDMFFLEYASPLNDGTIRFQSKTVGIR